MNEVKSPKKPLLYYYFVAMLLVMLFNFIAMPWLAEHQIKEVDYNTFVTMTEQGEVGRVEIQEQSNRILFTSSDEKTVYKTAMVPDDGLVQRLLDAGISTTGEEIEQTSTLVSILAWVLPIIIFVALGQYMSRKMMEKMGGGGNSMMFNMGKSNAKVYVKSAEGIKFDDVAGEDEAKENLTEVVNYLHDPSKYQEIGASMPKGILLVGPPGTGKTMLAKAVAGEANVPFFSMSGSEFVEMFVGMGASKVRDLFKQAKEKAPCIVFIDEIDKIAGRRGGSGPDVSREGVQRDILPIVEGSTVNTKYGPVKTDYMLFIAAGAFHVAKVSDLIPELQGRFPVHVQLKSLTREDFQRILTQPDNALTLQYKALLAVDKVMLTFEDSAIEAIANAAFTANETAEDIGARRLHAVFEQVLEDISFNAGDENMPPFELTINGEYVQQHLSGENKPTDLRKYIL